MEQQVVEVDTVFFDHITREKLAYEQPKIKTENIILLKSSAFEYGMPIPRKYTMDGDNTSPPLAWSHVPEGTKELVLLCEDSDATSQDEPYVHWIVYGISPEITSLAEGVKPITGAKKGLNSSETLDYVGPMPAPGHGNHHYYFQLFAIDSILDVIDCPERFELLQAMNNHVIAAGKLLGVYER